eukprot:gene19495-23312_t
MEEAEKKFYYLRSVGANPRKQASHFKELFPELAGDVEVPPFFAAESYFSSVMRVGTPKVQLWTHYDTMANILMQGRSSSAEPGEPSAAGGARETVEVRRIKNGQELSLERFNTEVVAAGEPAVLSGGAAWIGRGAVPGVWCPEYLADACGQRPVSVHVCKSPRLDFVHKNFKFENMSFAQLLEHCSNSPMVGTKRVVLFPPSEEERLYVQGSSSAATNIDDVDLERFPKLAGARRVHCTLHPGDSDDFSISINYFWRDLPPHLYQPKDLYGNRDPAPAEHAATALTEVVASQLPCVVIGCRWLCMTQDF